MIQDTGRGKNSETDAGIDGLSLSPNRPTVPSVSEVGLIATCQKVNIFYSLCLPFRFILQITLVAVLFFHKHTSVANKDGVDIADPHSFDPQHIHTSDESDISAYLPAY